MISCTPYSRVNTLIHSYPAPLVSLCATKQLNTKATLPWQLSHLDVPTITQLELHCPYSILYYPGPRTLDPESSHTPHLLIPGRLPNLSIHEPSPLQHSAPRDPKHLPTKNPKPSTLYLSAHSHHPQSTIATAPPILTHCDKSQSLPGPKLPLCARSQDARFPGGVLGLVRRCAVCCLQQVVRINFPSGGDTTSRKY